MVDRAKQFSNLDLIDINKVYEFNIKTTGIRLVRLHNLKLMPIIARQVIEWTGGSGDLCDLDLCALLYDEKVWKIYCVYRLLTSFQARFIEKITIDKPVSSDKSLKLEADTDNHFKSCAHSENIHIDLSVVDPQTSCMFLSVDGGTRNFRLVQRISIYCYRENVQVADSDFMSHIESSGFPSTPLFQCVHKSPLFPKMEAMALCCIYRASKQKGSDRRAWLLKNVCEGITAPTTGEKDGRCLEIALSAVPAYSRFQPRLFPNVKVICSALSSTALPNLKEKFQEGGGLEIQNFTEILFQQLLQSHPTLVDVEEAAYTIAMLQDMFAQIDFNGDGSVDWDEFTTFCIHTGLATAAEQTSQDESVANTTLENYTIEYAEDHSTKDTILSSHTHISQMRYSHPAKRLMVMKETSDGVMMFDEAFQQLCVLDPNTLPQADRHDKVKIHDCVYLPSKDLYAFCASDHTIVLVKEHLSRGGMYYTVVNKIHTIHLHVKLCWSEKAQILCSVGSDNMIYGWKTEANTPVFHISRHRDLVTDFIAVDELDLFITCSLDKRIVLWSQSSRRVKGILIGHSRGVRTMSYAQGVLLSAGFECEAKTWDVNLKEPTLILRGHRLPIAAAKIMCPADDSGDNVRAVTVDDGGEFRLWNVFVKEKSSDQGLAQVLQIFQIHAEEPMIGKVRFIELPFSKKYARGNYSNIIAGSTKLVHLIPEKNTAEFIPPLCMCYNEPYGCIVTAVGKRIYKYDICTGDFISAISNVDSSEISCMRLDGDFARRLFVGCTSGRLILMNFLTGDVIDTVNSHAKQILCIEVLKGGRKWVFTGALDGKIKCLESINGNLGVHVSIDNAIGDGKGIAIIKAVESLKLIVAASGGLYWGVWNTTTFRRLILIEEVSSIVGVEVIAASRDDKEIRDNIYHGIEIENVNMLTLAVCTRRYIKVYTMDPIHGAIANTHYFQHEDRLDMTSFTILRFPEGGSMNYNSEFNMKEAPQIAFIAGSYEGLFCFWDASYVRDDANVIYFKIAAPFYPGRLDFGRSTSMRSIVSRKNTQNDGEYWPHTLHEDENDKSMTDGIVDLANCGNSLDSVLLSTAYTKRGEGFQSHMSDDESHMEDDSSVFSLTHSTVDFVGHSANKGRRGSTLVRADTVVDDIIKTSNSDVVKQYCVSVMSSINSWVVHNDAVIDMVALHDHGCYLTVSIDGFHRVWNLDTDCLGEMLLPNTTDKMKAASRIKNTRSRWKFIMERIPVNVSHYDIASKLLATHKKKVIAEIDFRKGSRRQHGMGLFVTGDDHGQDLLFLRKQREESAASRKISAAPTQKDIDRCSLLADIKKRYTGDDDDATATNNIDTLLSPLRPVSNSSSSLPSAGIQQAQTSDELLPSLSARSPIIPPLSTSKQRSQTAAPGSKSRHSHNGDMQSICSLQSSTTMKSAASLWSSTQELCPNTNPAFSEHSINTAHQQALIDGEGHKLLRRVNHQPDRKDVYDRSTTKVLLRNVAMSTAVEVPRANSIEMSEVTFGSQKVGIFVLL